MTSSPPTVDASVDPSVLSELTVLLDGRRVAACIPARNEVATIAHVVEVVAALATAGLVDDIVVVDDDSHDGTGERAALAGARVIGNSRGPGKGEAMQAAVDASDGELLLFLDADVPDFDPRFVISMLEPLVRDPSLCMVKPSYSRPYRGLEGEGGRVTELLARPLLRRFRPGLAGIAQPLAGETAVRRDVVEGLDLASGYGVEIALLLDVADRYGPESIAQVELGTRAHRNRPLRELRPHSEAILAAVLERSTGESGYEGCREDDDQHGRAEAGDGERPSVAW